MGTRPEKGSAVAEHEGRACAACGGVGGHRTGCPVPNPAPYEDWPRWAGSEGGGGGGAMKKLTFLGDSDEPSDEGDVGNVDWGRDG